jgi:CRP/FNR family cyclic AMP-dependent transcriptional regulator
MAIAHRVELAEVRAEIEALEAFQNTDEEGLDSLCRMARCHDYPRGNILHYRGDTDDAIYVVIRGKVKIVLTSEEGREVVIDLLRPGDLLGLVAAASRNSHPAHAITATESRLAKFKRDTFLSWVEGQGLMVDLIWRQLAQRVRHAYTRIGEHVLLDVKARLMLTLLEIAEYEGEPASEGAEIVFTRPTHRELAERIGSSREVVTRLLSELLESDMLNAEGRIIRVPYSALILREE